MADAIQDFAAHVVGSSFDDLDPRTVANAKSFVLDTLGVGIGGSSGPMVQELTGAIANAGRGEDARVWATGQCLPAQSAALCNAYQIHNSEFDCLHEAAVAHVMTIVLPVALAVAERAGSVSGRRLIEAVALGVDVAAGIGVAATSGLRFFRPATAGAFGGVAALGKLMGLDRSKLVNAFSLAYGQMGGTMQAHTEGSLMLAMQMGFNARNAVVACDLAVEGFTGPENILEGPFGYYRLIEDGGDPGAVAAKLGKVWRIDELAYKPYPTGRATHGIIDGCLTLQRSLDIEATEIDRITARVPPLVNHLVGRPVKREMDINYARLCATYVAACALLRGTLGPEDFTEEAYSNAERQRLAGAIKVEAVEGDPNALTPIEIEMSLRNGSVETLRLDDVYGAPAKPMSRAAVLEKFQGNCARSAGAPNPEQAEALIAAVDDLENLPDVTRLVDLMVPERANA
ncbi:MAG: MmgE/PrpD family protein [Paracoccaceae bacterium]|nr:MmgE/PrpD family protein [Paracoccaceae bacterium]